MKNILIICTANKTRSVMAMEIAGSIAKKAGKMFNFKSAGIAVMGNEIDSTARRILSENGIETLHTPTAVEGIDLTKYDEIHVMTERHKDALCSYYKNSEIADKMRVLGIDDPFGKGENAYYDCMEKLKNYYGQYING